MKKNKKETTEKKQKKPLDKNQLFVRITAFILAGLMVFSIGGTLIYYAVS